MSHLARMHLIGSFAVWLACATGCQPGNAQKPIPTSRASLPAALEPTRIAFADVAKESGLVLSFPKQARPMRTLEAFGSGCAAFDGDNDGWQDVLVVADPHPVLFRNTGAGKFENVTPASGLAEVAADWIGCAIGDYDGDGLLDVLLTGFQRLALYKNLGDLRFQRITETAGLDPHNHGLWASSAGFMDLDGDQHLDLVILNFVEFGPHVRQYCELKPGVPTGCLPRVYVPQRGEIWRNTRQGGFELVPPENAMADTSGVGLVLAFSDVNQDGRMDIYIGNDGPPSELLLNRGDMEFENIGAISGLAYDGRGKSVASMGSDWGDYDRDGQMDLAVSNFQDSGFLVYRNLADNQFLDSSIPTGLAAATRNRLGFGTKWVDLDNDAWVDIFFVNGHVYDNVGDAVGPDVHFRQPLSLFQNRQGQTFVDVTPQMGPDVQRPLVGRGSATADFNNDGRIDLLGIDFEGPVMLLENRSQTGNHWITLDLRAAAPNRFAYGALLTGKTGDQIWVGEVTPASSYLSSSDPRVHWGLGTAARLDELKIRWPSGNTQTLRDVKADQILRVDEGAYPR
ncbi:MAG: CRTAC1 family protein [Pirellulaceae bacterium]